MGWSGFGGCRDPHSCVSYCTKVWMVGPLDASRGPVRDALYCIPDPNLAVVSSMGSRDGHVPRQRQGIFSRAAALAALGYMKG